MKSFLLAFPLLIASLTSEACKCMQRSFAQEVEEADQLFVGKVLQKTVGAKVEYSFQVIKSFKGASGDTVTITTGHGGGDCGVQFERGTSYLVYANDKTTNSCRRTAKSDNNPDVSKLAYLHDTNFSKGIATSNSPLLTPEEAAYFNVELLELRKQFDFTGKKVAFLYNNQLTDKQLFFKSHGGKDVAFQLVRLTESEQKKSGGYDAIIVYWRKLSVTAKQRKKLVKQLASR